MSNIVIDGWHIDYAAGYPPASIYFSVEPAGAKITVVRKHGEVGSEFLGIYMLLPDGSWQWYSAHAQGKEASEAACICLIVKGEVNG